MVSIVSRTRRIPAADSPEVDFALVLSRVIESVKQDPAELRNVVYEVARIKLQREAWNRDPPIDLWELRRLTIALETAIERVEAISSKQDQLRALKSLDRLIESLDQNESRAPTSSPNPVLVIDHAPITTSDDHRPSQSGALANRVPWIISELKFRYRLAPVLRVALVATFALALYAVFHGARQFTFPYALRGSERLPDAVAPLSFPSQAAEANLPDPITRRAASASHAEPRDFPLPGFYGVYAVGNGELYELDALPGKVPDQRIFMSAVMSRPSRTIIPNGRIAFVAFRRDLATNAPARASVRVIARILRAMSFTPGGKPTIAAVGDSWAVRNISYDLKVAPLADHPEMLIMRPETSDFGLPPGRYGMVLKDIAYDFTVAGDITEPAQCLERTEAANGTFYSECRKP